MHSSERLKGIDVFVAVADCGSFSAAAERLNLTGSAVSKSVARLEARLRITLFTRTTRSLALTDAGGLFYKTCTSVLGDLEEVEHALVSQEHELHGKVRIDLPASYGRLHVLPLVMDFVRLHPMLQPHISFTDRFIDPAYENVDIVVRIGGPDTWPANLGREYLGAQRMIFCASPDYVRRYGTPEHQHDLDRHQCIGYLQNDGLVSPWYFRGARPGEMERRVLHACLAVGDGEGAVTAVLAGHGIGQLPTWLTQRHIEQGTLVEVLPNLATDGLPMHMIWLKSRENVPKVRALLDHLRPRLTPDGMRITTGHAER